MLEYIALAQQKFTIIQKKKSHRSIQVCREGKWRNVDQFHLARGSKGCILKYENPLHFSKTTVGKKKKTHIHSLALLGTGAQHLREWSPKSCSFLWERGLLLRFQFIVSQPLSLRIRVQNGLDHDHDMRSCRTTLYINNLAATNQVRLLRLSTAAPFQCGNG